MKINIQVSKTENGWQASLKGTGKEGKNIRSFPCRFESIQQMFAGLADYVESQTKNVVWDKLEQ